MKLVIEHSQTKRTIEGQFCLCGSRQDLKALIKQIELVLADESWVYGWVTVYPSVSQQVNSHPKKWDE